MLISELVKGVFLIKPSELIDFAYIRLFNSSLSTKLSGSKLIY